MKNTVSFSKYTHIVVQTSPLLGSRTSWSPQREALSTLSSYFTSSTRPPPTPRHSCQADNLQSTFSPMDFPILAILCKQNHVMQDVLCLAAFSQCNGFSAHLWCSMNLVLYSYLWRDNIPSGIYTITCLFVDGQLDYLHFWLLLMVLQWTLLYQFLF